MDVLSWQSGAVLLALCHIYYAVLWFVPGMWCSLCKRIRQDPCYAMFIVALFFKAQQFGTIAWFALSNQSSNLLVDMFAADRIVPVLLSIVMIVVGQILNAGAIKALGRDGIYYGFRYGKTIPWCTSWPYGGALSVPHPQYVGAILSIAGTGLLLATPTLLPAGVMYLTLSWIGCYALNGVMEEFVHQLDWASKREKKR